LSCKFKLLKITNTFRVLCKSILPIVEKSAICISQRLPLIGKSSTRILWSCPYLQNHPPGCPGAVPTCKIIHQVVPVPPLLAKSSTRLSRYRPYLRNHPPGCPGTAPTCEIIHQVVPALPVTAKSSALVTYVNKTPLCFIIGASLHIMCRFSY
jgi:hypothetical protein